VEVLERHKSSTHHIHCDEFEFFEFGWVVVGWYWVLLGAACDQQQHEG